MAALSAAGASVALCGSLQRGVVKEEQLGFVSFTRGATLAPPQLATAAPCQAPPRGTGPLGSSSRAAVSTGEPASATEVKRVRLGASGVEVPPIGVGAWSWGDKFFWNEGTWSDRMVKDAKSAFEASMDSDLCLFDTAEVYGTKQFGGADSEKLLGKFIEERQRRGAGGGGERALIATKFAALPWRLGRRSVVDALRSSLERLGVPSVDLYQQHWPGLWGNEGYIDGLADCVELGLARAIGVSNFSEKRLRQAHAQLARRGVPLASNQVHYNLLYRVPEDNGVKAACDELGVHLVAYSPLAQGILSGKYTPDNRPKGPRGNSYSAEFLIKAQPLLTRMKELGQKYGKSCVQVALNWLIAQENVVPIPGAKNSKQAEEFAGALGWSLEDGEDQELRFLASQVPYIQGFPVEAF